MVDDLKEALEGIEAAVFDNELVSMSGGLPLWQRDALRRIAQHGELSDADADTLRTAMYAEYDLNDFSDDLTPLSADHCQVDPEKVPLAKLCAIGPVENINRLAIRSA